MAVLVIGKNGQLGTEIRVRAQTSGVEVIAVGLPGFDITKGVVIEEVVSRADVSHVINVSGYTAVDTAEKERETAFRVNGDGPRMLAESCSRYKKKLIHLSTDFVFNGNKETPYTEEDPTIPINIYGKSKLEGEIGVRENLREHVIVRTAWLFGVHGDNFVKTMLRLAMEKEEVGVVADQYGCPTYTGYLAEALLRIVECMKKNINFPWGTYHFCGAGVTSWFDFAEEIFREAKKRMPLKVNTVRPLTSEQYPTLARRPKNSALDCSLMRKELQISTREWGGALSEVVRILCGSVSVEGGA